MVNPSRPKASLRQVTGTDEFRHDLTDGDTITLGRSTGCSIVLDASLYSGVSRTHARLSPSQQFKSSGWQIEDVNSANGTYVNGERLTNARVLRAGDRITLGQNGPQFVFECDSVLAPAKQAAASRDSVSLTQLLPIASTGRELVNKAYLVPGILTVLFVIGMFNTIGNPTAFNALLGFYLAGISYLFVYNLCGKRKPWWLLVGTGVATAILLVSPVLDLCVLFFRQILPGDADTMMAAMKKGQQFSFIQQFITFFFGAGMLEEFLKAIPVLACYFIGNKLNEPWKTKIGVLEPLDGILLGAASGVGFTLYETLGQYVPNIIQSVSQQGGEGVAQMAGLQLLIPRIIGNVSGHMAYSGYLGYFIGLAALKQNPLARWQIIGIGYLSAALIHGLWDSVGQLGDLFLALVGATAFAFLTAAILKARKLSPTRNQNFATQVFEE